MSSNKLVVETRESTGKNYARAIRRDGKVPCVYYLHGEESLPLMSDARATRTLLASKPAIISLELNDGEKEALIREVQRDPVTGDIIHIDFMGFERGVKLTATVPVHLTNEDICAGVKNGGIIEHLLKEVEVECLPRYLPDAIEIDIVDLEIHDSLHVSDIVREGIEFLTRAEAGVVHIVLPKAVEEEVTDEDEEVLEGEEAAEEEEEEEDSAE